MVHDPFETSSSLRNGLQPDRFIIDNPTQKPVPQRWKLLSIKVRAQSGIATHSLTDMLKIWVQMTEVS